MISPDKEDKNIDPLFDIEEIIDHKINEKGLPAVLIKWSVNEDEYSWEKLHNIKKDDPVTLAIYIVKNRFNKDKKFLFKWTNKFLF